MICKNWRCKKEFERTHNAQKYCCDKCSKRGHQDIVSERNRNNPLAAPTEEKRKNKSYAKTARSYKSGKLPYWMFS